MGIKQWLERLSTVEGDAPKALPRLGGDKRVVGELKTRPSDFIVREVPLYELERDGPHLYFEIEKRGITTNRVRERLARHMNVSVSEIGYAGKKDRKACTVQRMSLEHADPDRLKKFETDRVKLNILGLHRNKLKPGHLAGNRFEIKLRPHNNDFGDEVIDHSSWQEQINSVGVPNYYGSQRFGRRGDTARLGKLLVTDQLKEFVEQYLGRPSEHDPEPVRQARCFFAENQFERAYESWPDRDRIRRKALKAYMDSGKPGLLLSTIPRNQRRFFVSAFQSSLFNEQVAARIPDLNTLYRGDIAKKRDTGGLFEVENPEQEQPRVRRGNIHPTGSLPGTDPWEATGPQGELEQAVQKKHGVTPDDFQRVSYLGASGSRRPMRIFPEDWQTIEGKDSYGPYLEVCFQIRSGAYATVVLREFFDL